MFVFRAKLRSWKHIMTMARHFRFLAPLGMTGAWLDWQGDEAGS